MESSVGSVEQYKGGGGGGVSAIWHALHHLVGLWRTLQGMIKACFPDKKNMMAAPTSVWPHTHLRGGSSLPVSLYNYFYVHIREGTQDRELSGNANEGGQDIHPTTAVLSIHTARKRPIQTKQDMKVVWQGRGPMLPWGLKSIKQRWTSLPV